VRGHPAIPRYRREPRAWRLPARRCSGHGPQGRPRLLVRAPSQRDEGGGGQGSLLDRHVGLLLEEAEQPARGDPLVSGVTAGRPHISRSPLVSFLLAEHRQGEIGVMRHIPVVGSLDEDCIPACPAYQCIRVQRFVVAGVSAGRRHYCARIYRPVEVDSVLLEGCRIRPSLDGDNAASSDKGCVRGDHGP
jgi:hypothetical protein